MDDLILRRQAIDAFNTNLNELVVGGEENAKTVENYLNRVLDKIKCLPSALGTNLAEVGTDCISRQEAIDALNEVVKDHSITDFDAIASILDLPPAQPEIIRCRNCKFASGDSRICMKFGHSPIGELDFCAWAERRTDE